MLGKVLKKNFKTKILITKMYNNINKCSTFAAAVLRQHFASTLPVLSSQVSVVTTGASTAPVVRMAKHRNFPLEFDFQLLSFDF